MEKQKIGNNLFPSYFRMTDKYISSPQTFYLQQIKYVHCRDTLQSVRDFKIKNNSRAESPMVYQPGAAPQVCNTPTKALCRSKGYILLFQSAKFFFILTYGAAIGWKSISPSGKICILFVHGGQNAFRPYSHLIYNKLNTFTVGTLCRVSAIRAVKTNNSCLKN